MALGYGVAIGAIFRWLDTLWPSKKEALVEELQKLEVAYEKALKKNDDTGASIIRKRMVELRKKAEYASE